MNGDTIKEFLVGLGFDIDESGMRKFTGAVAGATKGVLALGAAVGAMYVAVDIAVRKTADRFETLYYASQRTGASVERINALGYAFEQMGGRSEDAMSALESIASFMRSSPGASRWLAGMGVDASSGDASKILGGLVESFKKMPFYAAKMRASLLGISEQQLLILLNGEGINTWQERYIDLLHRAGVDQEKAADASKEYNQDLRDTGAMFAVLWQKVILRFLSGNASLVKRFNAWLGANYDDIVAGIDVLIEKLKAVADWFEDGFKAAKKGKFLEWIFTKMAGLIVWFGRQWEKLQPVISPLFDWMEERLLGIMSSVTDKLRDGLVLAIGDVLPDWIRSRLGMFNGADARINQFERENRDKAHRIRMDEALNRMKQGMEALGDFVMPAAEASTGSLDSMFAAAEQKYGLQSGLLRAMGWMESRFKSNAVSPAGALGIMQFMPATAREYGIDPMVPSQAIDGAGRYMRKLLDMFGGDVTKAVAAYNAGPGNVQKYGGIPPFTETRNYVRGVRANMSGVTVNQSTNIHVAATDAADAARRVMDGQSRVNAGLGVQVARAASGSIR